MVSREGCTEIRRRSGEECDNVDNGIEIYVNPSSEQPTQEECQASSTDLLLAYCIREP